MACPFARFKSVAALSGVAPFHGKASTSYHGHDHPKASTSKSMTAVLKEATWAAHRAIERSPGVAALMGAHSTSDTSHTLERIDYVRFLVMLLCVYADMEAAMVEGVRSGLLAASFNSIVDPLLRTSALRQDIQDHINELCGHAGATATELLTYIGDSESETASSRSASKRYELAASLTAALATIEASGKVQGIELNHGAAASYIALLDDRQVQAASAYASRVSAKRDMLAKATYIDRHHSHYDEGISLTPPLERSTPSSSRSSSPALGLSASKSEASVITVPASVSAVSRLCVAAASALSARIGNLVGGDSAMIAANERSTLSPAVAETASSRLVAHIYVRYMGDLSGGQHMVRRLSKLFPVDTSLHANAGFHFFAFKDGNALKNSLRAAIDGMPLSRTEQAHLATEASLAFDLNRGLFDTLVSEVL